MIEEIIQYAFGTGMMYGVFKAATILADIRNVLKTGESWMNEHKPIIKTTFEAVQAHQRGGYELGQRVQKLDGTAPPTDFESPHL